eukprot:TRINITY_DN5616_c0_g1_i1.p1 TRINITY_DN5616_c0_g1~~TRINITY_DN5616_c0_g1_i1.p1  ORF type:complete len:251 (+),score=20.81 TRINITY_DN5616_c0_g1_i1:31-753(+)
MEPERSRKSKYIIKTCPVLLSGEQKQLYRRLLERNDTFKFDAGNAKLSRRLASVCTHPFLVPNAEKDYYDRIVRTAEDPSVAKKRPQAFSLQEMWKRKLVGTRKNKPIERFNPCVPGTRTRTAALEPPAQIIPSLPEDVLILIFGVLGSPDLVGPMAIVCSAWKKAAQSDLLWRPFCERSKLQKGPCDSYYTTFMRQFDGLLVSFSHKFEMLAQIVTTSKSTPEPQQHIIIGTGECLLLV